MKRNVIINAAKGFALALSMLTTLPFFKVHDFFKGINGYAVMFYPLVGFLLGALLFGVYTVLEPYFPVTHLKIILLFLWVALTGALHLDGLSDTIDALFVSKDRAEEVMKDSHIGAMGMSFTVLFLILKASALWHLEALWSLPLILMLARFNTVVAVYSFPYIRENGMGALAKKEFTRTQLLLSAIFISTVSFMFPLGFILLSTSLPLLLFLKFWFTKRFGGFSGDLYGFVIEATELLLLHVILVHASL